MGNSWSVVTSDPALGRRCVERRPGQLVEVDGDRVRDEHLPTGSAEEDGAEPVTDAGRQVHPGLPAPDEVAAPLVRDEGGQSVAGARRQRTEAVAVQVDQARIGAQQERPLLGQGVRRVERGGVLLVRDHERQARGGRASSPQRVAEPGTRE